MVALAGLVTILHQQEFNHCVMGSALPGSKKPPSKSCHCRGYVVLVERNRSPWRVAEGQE